MPLFVTGTDTGVGKSHACAAIMVRYRPLPGLRYWKPVQTGSPPDDDTRLVARLAGLAEDQIALPAWVFRAALSPHRAAELEDAAIDEEALGTRLSALSAGGPLLVEGAGGILVPLNRRRTWLDFVKESGCSVLVTARTTLGTINHTLLTLAHLRQNGIEPVGVVFCGPPNPDNSQTIREFGRCPVLGDFEYSGDGPIAGDLDPEGVLERHLLRRNPAGPV